MWRYLLVLCLLLPSLSLSDTRRRLAFAPSGIPTDNLEAFWRFNNNANDETANNHDGTEVGSPVYSTSGCVEAQCIALNGTTQYVEITTGGPSPTTNDFAVSVWVQRDTLGVRHAVYGDKVGGGADQEGLMFFTLEANTLYSQIATGTTNRNVTTTGTVADVNWHHLVVNVDRSADMEVFINNVSAGSVDVSALDGQSIVNAINFHIGVRILGVGRSYYFDGRIDLFRFYNRVLTAAERTALCEEGAGIATCS